MNIDITIAKASKTVCTLDEGSVTVRLGLNDTITWHNTTNKKAILLMPHDQVADGQDHFHRKIDENGGTTMVTITAPNTGKYRYGIFCRVTNSFAIGSDPEIIVQ
jgi:plastocyanin